MGVLRYSTIDKGEIQDGTLTMRLLAACSSLDDSVMVLRRDLAQFQKWQPHPTEPGFFVDQFRATQRQHTPNWECQVDYIDTIQRDPLAIPARIGEVKSFTIPGATLVDYRGAPIVNTAGDLVEPFDKPEQVLCYPIIKNIPGLGDWLFDFESCINADAVRLGSKMCDPKTLMIRQVTVSDEQTQGDISYRTATLELWRRKSKWVEVWPSRGFYQIVKGDEGISRDRTGKGKRPIIVANSVPNEPGFLDANGAWIQNPTLADLYLITTQIYPEINFTNYFPL